MPSVSFPGQKSAEGVSTSPRMAMKRVHDESLEETDESPKRTKISPQETSQSTMKPGMSQLPTDVKPAVSEHHQSSSQTQGAVNSKDTVAQALNFAPLLANSSQTSQQTSSSARAQPPYTGHPSTLPLLPPILSESLSLVPFTHPGYFGGSNGSRLQNNYDRLEFLGDAYIELIATRLIFTLFPNLPAGRLSQHRELCVKNETLSEYAHAYGFDQRARLPAKMDKADKKTWTKIMGDIFEAYVAAIIMSDPQNGFQTAEAWLTSLWHNKLIPKEPKAAFETQTVNADAKSSLARKVISKGIKLDYREEGPPKEIKNQGKIVYYIGAYLTGWGWQNQHLGSGSGLSKTQAGAVAAAEALKNPLVEKANASKREYDAKVAAEKAAREEGEV